MKSSVKIRQLEQIIQIRNQEKFEKKTQCTNVVSQGSDKVALENGNN